MRGWTGWSSRSLLTWYLLSYTSGLYKLVKYSIWFWLLLVCFLGFNFHYGAFSCNHFQPPVCLPNTKMTFLWSLPYAGLWKPRYSSFSCTLQSGPLSSLSGSLTVSWELRSCEPIGAYTSSLRPCWSSERWQWPELRQANWRQKWGQGWRLRNLRNVYEKESPGLDPLLGMERWSDGEGQEGFGLERVSSKALLSHGVRCGGKTLVSYEDETISLFLPGKETREACGSVRGPKEPSWFLYILWIQGSSEIEKERLLFLFGERALYAPGTSWAPIIDLGKDMREIYDWVLVLSTGHQKRLAFSMK